MDILDRYLERTPGSAALAQQARSVLPGGIVADTRYFQPYGIYVHDARGTRKWDVDGNEYLDFFGGHGAHLMGHSHPVLVETICEAVRHGVQHAANHPLEVALAERVQRLVPSAEKVRFTGSGTEATLLAIRLARAYCGRSMIVRVATHYHGWHDHAAAGYADRFDGSAAPGVLAEVARQTLLIRPDDDDGLRVAVKRHGKDIAAFIAEPLGSVFGMVPTSNAFLHQIERAASEVGALFILDEVLSGFRVAPGGLQSLCGLRPDLTTLAKILCGGMQGGAVAGRDDIMALLDPDAELPAGRERVRHQGTFTANPVSMAAGIAMLDLIVSSQACERATALGSLARQRLNELFEAEKLPMAWYGNFSIFHLFANPLRREIKPLEFSPEDHSMEEFLAKPDPLFNRLRMALNVIGIDLNVKCSGLTSAVHSEDDIDELVSGMEAAIRMLREESIL